MFMIACLRYHGYHAHVYDVCTEMELQMQMQMEREMQVSAVSYLIRHLGAIQALGNYAVSNTDRAGDGDGAAAANAQPLYRL